MSAESEGLLMRRNWPLITAFSIAYTFFLSAPAVFHQEFPLRTDMEWGDVLDIATPLVVFGFVWLLVRRTVGTVGTVVAFPLLLIALVWTQGQGMHLASNSIGHQVREGESGSLPDLIHFYDEQLSHYIWYLGVVALQGFLLIVMWRDKALAGRQSSVAVLPAALLYGGILAIDAIEGAVVPMALPAFVLITVLAAYLYRSKSRLRGVELFAFTGATVFVALGVLLGWGAYHGGWPEPSDLGLI
jgi:hypothetical protein